MKEIEDLKSLREIINFIFPTSRDHVGIQISKEDGVVLIATRAALERGLLANPIEHNYGDDFKPMMPYLSKKELTDIIDRSIELLNPIVNEVDQDALSVLNRKE